MIFIDLVIAVTILIFWWLVISEIIENYFSDPQGSFLLAAGAALGSLVVVRIFLLIHPELLQ